ncbi:hypothetical protein DXG01_012233 [Tephrocybe rancida]|nr:hypothetical protein DXG01_012233 [Tephrocybe rancida]
MSLDQLDGGISVLLRCPGFKVPAIGTEGVTVDLAFPPRELAAGGKELSKTLCLLIQSFGNDIALPYLRRFEKRCLAEGVLPPSPPAMQLRENRLNWMATSICQLRSSQKACKLAASAEVEELRN